MILHVVGARPQFIKLAPVTRAMHCSNIPFKVLHTGQHYDHNMSAGQFAALQLPEPDFNLGIGSGSHARQTADMLTGIEEVLLREKTAMVMVYGDTNSTLAAALCAAKLHIPIAHVEAGVRSYDRRMPEEINRVTTDHMAEMHFCPTPNAVRLLGREGIRGILTGDVMLDVLDSCSKNLPQPRFKPPFALATIHRAENTDNAERFAQIWSAFKTIASRQSLILPVHPRTRALYPDLLQDAPDGLQVIEPVTYLEMIALVKAANLVVTDSGGVQKEAFLLETPCVTVRDVTEWPETVDAGVNMLVRSETAEIIAAVEEMGDLHFELRMNPFGDGRASSRIADAILRANIL